MVVALMVAAEIGWLIQSNARGIGPAIQYRGANFYARGGGGGHIHQEKEGGLPAGVGAPCSTAGHPPAEGRGVPRSPGVGNRG